MTPPTELVITLPLPPNRANARNEGHWAVTRKKREAYMELCEMAIATQECARNARGKREVQLLNADALSVRKSIPAAYLGFTLYVGNRMDDDNALARTKWACDFLVSALLLADDKRPHCSMSIPSQVITRDKSKQKLVITIKYEDSNG